MNRIGIVAKKGETRALDAARDLVAWLEGQGLSVVLQPALADLLGHPATPDEGFAGACDLVIVLGGDGTLLYAARMVGPAGVPIFPVNLGHLGFLCNSAVNHLIPSLQKILAGECEVVERLLLCGEVRGEKAAGPFWALNDLVIHLGSVARTMTLRITIDGFMAVPSLVADGLIVSSPTGSTAYNLSAGGPILRNDLAALVILPISPHTLTNRPVVDSADRVYELVVAEPNTGTTVVVDGRVLCMLQPGDRVQVQRAAVQFKLVAAPGHSYYRTLREKLGWGGKLQLDK